MYDSESRKNHEGIALVESSTKRWNPTNAPIKGPNFRSASETPFANAISTTGLPNIEFIMVIGTASINFDTYTMPGPTILDTMDFKSQLKVKVAVIASLQENVQNLFWKTKERSLVIAK